MAPELKEAEIEFKISKDELPEDVRTVIEGLGVEAVDGSSAASRRTCARVP